jgi:uncharacterized membrane protein YeaQ/YmgE (transglycosylase-associated protein family)
MFGLIGSIIMWLVVGFLAGLLAKAIVPGPAEKPSGFLGTAILGIVGAIVGGFIYHFVSGGNSGFRTHFDLMSILWATLGAIIVVGIERAMAGRRAI